MIFNTDTQKEIEQVGEIKNNNISIDSNNIDFIVTILSTNLYSNPIESFIRETVSNAWDSHVEAGISEPVIVELGKDTEENYFCRIQDFGVGLSEERFNNIYKNIGSSTKRSDNNQLGGFGIGRFAALAYSDIVYITSVYNKEEFKYMMYKDGNTISIDLLHKQTTEKRNGLEVYVNLNVSKYNNTDLSLFCQAVLKQLPYFENLYFIDSTGIYKDSVDYFNNLKIKKYKNFSVNSLSDSHFFIKILLGKVLYPLRMGNLNKNYDNKIKNYPIALNFEIGELEITPNREEILYSKKNIKNIEDRLDAALDEIKNLYIENTSKNYDNVDDYFQTISNPNNLILLKNDTREIAVDVSNIVDTKNLKITLNNKYYDIPNFIACYKDIFNSCIFKNTYIFKEGRISFYGNFNSTGLFDIFYKYKHQNSYVFCDVSKLNNTSKKYIRENFSTTHFLKPESYFSYCRGFYDPNHIEILKILFKYFSDKISKVKTFDDSCVPQSWIDQKKKEAKALRLNSVKNSKTKNVLSKENVKIYEVRQQDRSRYCTTSDVLEVPLNSLHKYFKKLTIYAKKGDPRLETLYFALNRHVNLIEVAPTKIKKLEGVKNFVKIDNFMNNLDYKILKNVGTAMYIEDKLPFLEELVRIQNLDLVSKKLKDVSKDLYDFSKKYSELGYNRLAGNFREEIYQLCLDNNLYNEEIKSIVDKNYKMLYNSQFLFYLLEKRYAYAYKIPEEKINFAIDYILARKLFKPNLETIKKLKEETILNIKKEENENN